MKKFMTKIKKWIITSLGGCPKEEIANYTNIFKACTDAINKCMNRNKMLVKALKDSNILFKDSYGVKYSYNLCKYCAHKNNCNKDCVHGEDFIFAENWEEN